MRFVGYEQSLALRTETISYVKMFALRICQLNSIYSSQCWIKAIETWDYRQAEAPFIK